MWYTYIKHRHNKINYIKYTTYLSADAHSWNTFLFLSAFLDLILSLQYHNPFLLPREEILIHSASSCTAHSHSCFLSH